MKNACKNCRREGEKLFLKSERCYGTKCAMIKRPYGPGDHGPKLKKKVSEYGRQLREKQKLSSLFGISAGMMERLYVDSEKAQGSTSDNLIKSIFLRLDNIVFSLGLFESRSSARQAVSHKNILLNGKKVTVPSMRVKIGDNISVNNYDDKDIKKSKLPQWIEYDIKNKIFTIKREPQIEEIDLSVNYSLVVEYYSR